MANTVSYHLFQMGYFYKAIFVLAGLSVAAFSVGNLLTTLFYFIPRFKQEERNFNLKQKIPYALLLSIPFLFTLVSIGISYYLVFFRFQAYRPFYLVGFVLSSLMAAKKIFLDKDKSYMEKDFVIAYGKWFYIPPN